MIVSRAGLRQEVQSGGGGEKCRVYAAQVLLKIIVQEWKLTSVERGQ
jgi:hypothetical protein